MLLGLIDNYKIIAFVVLLGAARDDMLRTTGRVLTRDSSAASITRGERGGGNKDAVVCPEGSHVNGVSGNIIDVGMLKRNMS